MPSLHSYGSEIESDDESDLDSAIDVTRLYIYGELEDDWSETMEEETMEELNNNEMLANYMESDFSLDNPQKVFPGSIELLKSPDIWIRDTGAIDHISFSKKGGKNVKKSP